MEVEEGVVGKGKGGIDESGERLGLQCLERFGQRRLCRPN